MHPTNVIARTNLEGVEASNILKIFFKLASNRRLQQQLKDQASLQTAIGSTASFIRRQVRQGGPRMHPSWETAVDCVGPQVSSPPLYNPEK
jgi:hypothetical protein